MESMREGVTPRPSEVIADVHEMFPNKKEEDIREAIMYGVRYAAETKGRKISVSDYKGFLSEYAKATQDSREQLRSVFTASFITQEYRRILGDDRIKQLEQKIIDIGDPYELADECAERAQVRIHEDTPLAEAVFIVQEESRAVIERQVAKIFSDPEVVAIIDDEVLQAEIMTHYSKTLSNMLAQTIGVRADAILSEQDLDIL